MMHIIMLSTAFLLSKECVTCLSIQQGEHIADQISTKLKDLISTITQHKKLQRTYENLYEEKILKVKNLDVTEVSLKFRDNLERLLLKHMDTVLDIKKKTIELHTNYTYDTNIETFNYYNRKQENPVRVEPIFSLTKKININKSYVQVPTDIFRNDKQILNDAKWTLPLDNVYHANMDKIPSLLWQYFGRESGMFRSFPGKNTPLDSPDYYDCRRRLWYNQAINSPKDILIAVDLSGSMTGSHFNIARVTIKSLVDTLQQDDFFNIIFYNNERVQYTLQSCSKQHLFQATSDNKKLFKSAIDQLPNPRGQSSVYDLLKEAFTILKVSMTNEMTSSTCNQAIMLISDGMEEDNRLENEINDWNIDRDVVIFSYIVGSGTRDKEMKQLACNNGGDYYNFPTIGNVWDGVLKYQKIFSKPVSTFKNQSVIFTPLYLDSGGLGMMTTISAPVFSNKDNQTLLGVVGIDIRVTLLELQYPVKSLGIFGHAFAINNNGLFLIHPKFRDQSGYLPDPATVFLNEIEHTVNFSSSYQLMQDMVDMKTGCIDAELDWMYHTSYLRVVRLNVTYCYHPVHNTPFKSGVSIPLKNQKISIVSEGKLESFFKDGIIGLTTVIEGKKIEIAEWLFCDIPSKEQMNQPASVQFYPSAKELQEHLQNENYSSKCDDFLLTRLLLSSAVVSNFTEQSWSREEMKKYNILETYLITASGYITSLTNQSVSRSFSDDAIDDESSSMKSSVYDRNIFENERFTHPVAYAISSDDENVITITVEIKQIQRKISTTESTTPQNLHIGISLYATKHKILESVAGITISSDIMKEIFQEIKPVNDFECINCNIEIQETDENLINCSSTNTYHCYLIDENAYVVYSNQNKQDIGIFYGFVNGFLMREFIKKGLYNENTYNDTQAQCENKYIVITEEEGEKYVIKNESCTKRMLLHTRSKNMKSYKSYFNITSICNQTFLIIPVKQTNMALIVLKKKCKTNGVDFILSNEPIRIDQSLECGRTLKYRKSIEKCYKLKSDIHKCETMDTDSTVNELKTYITIISSFSTLLLLIIFIMCN